MAVDILISDNIGDLWDSALAAVIDFGDVSSPRGMKTLEVIAAQLILTDMRNNILVNKVRDLNFRFSVAEWLWIMAGREDVQWIAQYNKAIAQFSDDGNIFNGAYGPRLRPQWLYVINQLKNHPDTRQAVSVIWTPSPQPSKDIPCTLCFQFLLRKGKLHMIATMRSSDMWLGLPYDIFNFSQIGNCIAGEIGAEPSSLTMQLGSMHLYEPNWKSAENIIENEKSEYVSSPTLPGYPCIVDDLLDHEVWSKMDSASLGIWDYYAQVLHKTKSKAAALEVLRVASKTFA